MTTSVTELIRNRKGTHCSRSAETALPTGFDHPHASEQARRIAEEGMILRVQVGAGVHGTSIDGQDDRDVAAIDRAEA